MKKSPVPQGNYIPASRHNDLVYTAGMTPRKDGVLQLNGKIKASEPIDTYRDAVRLAAGNALLAARNIVTDQEYIHRVVTLSVFIATEEGFTAHAKIADFASEYFHEELGDAGVGSRAAIGVASLPGNAPVEIQLVAAVSKRSG